MPLASAEKITACQKCGECCRRYAISVLPNEVRKQAKALNISKEQFLRIYTQLLLQITSAHSGEHPLSIHTSMLPKDFVEILQKRGIDTEYVMLLPMIGFKKKEYCVFFDHDSFGCAIHPVKPLQCSLFPFVGINVDDYAKEYTFCEMARITSPTKYTYAQVGLHGKNMKEYFDTVASEGMEKVWPFIPAKGVLLVKGNPIGTIYWAALKEWLDAARTKKKNDA
ncbi:MAG: YkgJ family cysteine cluster protein [Candidatus Diapherotrites archaeon]